MPTLEKEQLLSIIQDKRPPTLSSLKNSLNKMKIQVGDEELITMVRQLSGEGLVNLDPSSEPASTFSEYLIDPNKSGWLYCSLVLALLETLLVEFNPSDAILATCRLILGFALMGFLPGYSMVRLVFPRGGLVILELLVLSVFLSILLSILTGVVLGSLDALQATSNVLFLTVLTFGLSVAAAYRSQRSGI